MAVKIAPLRGTYGINKRNFGEDDPRTQDAKRSLTAARVEIAIERIVADAPPLTPAQVDRLVGVISRAGAPRD